VLLKGPPAVGYRTDLWTLQRVAEVIDEHFDVQYHPSHVWKLLRDLGWSCQMPVRRALRRDEEAIAQWRRSRWYHIKNADRLGAHLVSVDESGFLLTPNITRTWAPKGHTPLLLYMYKQHRISAVSALVVSPKRRRGALYLAFRARNLTGLDTRAFLGDLLRHLRGPVVLLCDRGTILVRKEVTRYIAHHPRLHVEFFPAHAPELNPAEYVWNQTDRSLLNAAPEDIPEPYGMLHKSVRKLRRSQKLLWSCILCIRFALYKVSLSITYAKLNKKDHDLKSI
jgi:transposase